MHITKINNEKIPLYLQEYQVLSVDSEPLTLTPADKIFGEHLHQSKFLLQHVYLRKICMHLIMIQII